MLLEPSDKILLAHRRLFENDAPRHFVGEVLAYEDGIVKVRGYSFVRHLMSGVHLRKDDVRTKLFPLTSSAFLVYELPRSVDIEALRFVDVGSRVVLTDEDGFVMNMSEGPTGAVG